MSDSLKELMRRRGAPEAAEPEASGVDDFNPADFASDGRRPFTLARVKKQPGFFVVMAKNKRRYWVWYHSIRDLMIEEEGGSEFVEFSHENLAVTIMGRSLDHLINLIALGKLAAVFEPDARPLAAEDGPTVITGIRASLLSDGKNGRANIKLAK